MNVCGKGHRDYHYLYLGNNMYNSMGAMDDICETCGQRAGSHYGGWCFALESKYTTYMKDKIAYIKKQRIKKIREILK